MTLVQNILKPEEEIDFFKENFADVENFFDH